jgi:hypothetical protein
MAGLVPAIQPSTGASAEERRRKKGLQRVESAVKESRENEKPRREGRGFE